MYAVIETGGKQYRVEVGTELAVEYLDVAPGEPITIERVLLVADGDDSSIGRPLVPGASVSAEVVRQALADKVISFKYRPKARRRVKKGHRQELTILRVTDVRLGERSAAQEAREAADAAKTERERLEEAAARQAAEDAALAARLAERTKKASATSSGEPQPSGAARSEAKATDAARPARRSRAKAAEAAEADAAPDAAPPDAVPPDPAETPGSTTDEDAPPPAPRRSRTKKDE
jgi:large subunit ribosomal protein L21